MNKLQELKEAMQTPPPERLAKIEYQSHFMTMLGVSVVCVVLIMKGLWYIIFAFIFSLGVSYSQGMTAYAKYKNIMFLVKPEHPSNYDKDISPTRRRSKIINYVFKENAKWASIVTSVIVSVMIIGPPTLVQSLAYFILIPTIFTLMYFFIFYWMAYPIYKREVKIK
ncbi:hypothetical protein LCGC14_0730090 [marine sediment metagenome]|uniref:Uncharacterized protein n=1 Tax=marine sediment metagenome TaxID=412755 RepID=A0A0F9TH77_9ZZZZ